jgi:hypothetical protein
MNETPTMKCTKGHLMVRLIGTPAVHFKGYFPGKRIKEVDARKGRMERRINAALKSGKMTKRDVQRMAAIRDKYSRGSPYYDPSKARSQTAEADPTKGFDDSTEHKA